ncbi:Xenotropic and polytropic retrovirus receptor 1, variant 3 [Balamuthia mandrillaris]
MKFGKQLQHHMVVQWEDQYISYSKLKKILKQIRAILNEAAAARKEERTSTTEELSKDLLLEGEEDNDGTTDELPLLSDFRPSPADLDDEEEQEVLMEEGGRGGGLGPNYLPAHRRASSKSRTWSYLRRKSTVMVESATKGLENEFFEALRADVKKIEDFYLSQLAILDEKLVNAQAQAKYIMFLRQERKNGDKTVERGALVVKKALVNIYRHLMMLFNYVQLNHTGFFKILKKHDKITGLNMKDTFMDIVENTEFYNQQRLKELSKEAEEMYAQAFTNGSKDKAKAILWARQHDAWHWKTMLLGLLTGMIIPLLFFMALFAAGGDFVHQVSSSDWKEILPVYRLFFIPILAVWLWGINVLVWHKSRINYVYIFGFKPGHSLDAKQIFTFAAFLSVIWLTTFVLYLGTSNGNFTFIRGIPVHTWPLLLTIIMSSIFFCPFNMFHRSTRWILFKTIFHVIASPIGPLRFYDAYIGDVLTSMVKTIVDFQYTSCYYLSGDFTLNPPTRCKMPNKYLPPFLAFMPLFWRLMQCFKRFAQTWDKQHLFNAAKYGIGFGVILFSSLHGDYSVYSDNWNASRVLWAVLFVVSTLYTFSWDYLMDWGFGEWKNNPHFPLRRKLFYPTKKWFYYYVIITNFFFRFFWTLTISGLPFYIMNTTLLGWIAATVEIVRYVHALFFICQSFCFSFTFFFVILLFLIPLLLFLFSFPFLILVSQ